MVKKKDYLNFFKEEIITRFNIILKLLDQQDSDSSTYQELKDKSKEWTNYFDQKLSEQQAKDKFNEIFSDMKKIRKQLYSFEKVDMIIVEFCDLINNKLGKKEIYFEVAIPDDEKKKIEKNNIKKQKKNKNTPKTIQLIEKPKKKRYLMKSFTIILLTFTIILFLIPSGVKREYTEHIFPRTVNTTVNVTENISLAKYNNEAMYYGSTLKLKGKIEYVKELNKYNVSTYNIYLVDNQSNKILLEWIKRNDLELLNKDGITEDYFLVQGDYDFKEIDTGVSMPILYVSNLEKTVVESWEETKEIRLPGETITKEKELTLGMMMVYGLLDKENITYILP